jgi:hypothetical protein
VYGQRPYRPTPCRGSVFDLCVGLRFHDRKYTFPLLVCDLQAALKRKSPDHYGRGFMNRG